MTTLCQAPSQIGTELVEYLDTWRNLALAFLRRDLDIVGLETYETYADANMLKKLQHELEASL